MQKKTPLPLLDRIVEYFAPVRGAARMSARLAMAQMRGYEAARRDRNFKAGLYDGSANAEIGIYGADLATIQARARELVRDTPHATRAKAILKGSIVGYGITPRLAGKDKAEKRVFREDLDEFVETCDPEGMLDLYGLQSLAVGTIIESGECLIRRTILPEGKGGRIPLRYQVLEPDYLDTRKTLDLPGGGYIVHGVEFDAFGARVAYWAYDRHPGDVPFGRKLESRRFLNGEIRTSFDILRPGQARGIPWFAPVILAMRDQADIRDAVQMQHKVAACYAAFITRPGGSARAQMGPAEFDGNGDRLEKLRPGIIQYLNPGEAIEFGDPPSVGGISEHLTHVLREIAAGIGVTYEALTGDNSQGSYISTRANALNFGMLNDHWQWHMAVPQICRPIGQDLQMVRRMMGRAGSDRRVIWSPPTRPLLDPGAEVEALKNEVRSGLKSLRAAIAERGYDPDEVLDEIEETNADLDLREIVLDTDPRQGTMPGSPGSGVAAASIPLKKEEETK